VTGNNKTPSSVLSSGKWYKVAVIEDGIYRINFTALKQLGLDNPSCPRIFGNNDGQLSYYNDNTEPDDLNEIALSLQKGNDGVFNEGDYLLFYAENTHKWKFDYTSGEFEFLRHNYSDTSFYFITSGNSPGKSVQSAEVPASQANCYSSESDALFIHETETENLLKSGREWYQPVSFINMTDINPGFTGIITSRPVKFSARVLARASVSTVFRFYEAGAVMENTFVTGVDLNSTTGTFANISESHWESLPQSSSPAYQLKFFNNGENSATAWLDFIKIHARKSNIFTGETSFYTDINTVGPGNITRFTIETVIDKIVIWDITDPYNAKKEQIEKSGNKISFSAVTDSLKKYVAFTDDRIKSPLLLNKPVANQDLHASGAADMIIVSHPLFREYATRLAEIHLQNSGLTSILVTPEQIYNEFSGGIPDIAAIRNFVRMKFLNQKSTDRPLKYLLFFGDGSCENKSPPPGNTNFIPTYQSRNSNVIISSFTSDDFYGLLEDGEGEDIGTIDIGIGRLPVSDTTQAGILVSKIRNYLDPSNQGDWKNIVCLIADDEDGNTHLSDSESLSEILADSATWINTDKIYFDSFKQTTSPTGQSYPNVTQAINERINNGALIINYIGHGNENSLAHERVITSDVISQWKNKSNLPLFITATCEFSRFDNIDINPVSKEITGVTSAGEKILLNKNGGGIALMSTTRLAYSSPNLELNRHIFNFAFEPDSEGKAQRLGDIIRYAKNNSGNNINRRNFVLLGDPAVRIGYPWHGKIVTDSINRTPVKEGTDTLKALSKITVSGHAEDASGRLLNKFNGKVIPTVFGKPVMVRTLANDGGEKTEFSIRKNILFSGKTDSRNGIFSFTFIVPRDIDYDFGKGKISYYASDDSIDLTGVFSEITVGGFDNDASSDTSGPLIRLFLNDTLFRNGGLSDPNPRLYAIIEDKDGINTAGTGIGHDLICWLDNDRDINYVLNNYFENDYSSYGKGSVEFQLSGLKKGNHSLTLKAWDNFNNSSEKTISFLVDDGELFILRDLVNYPNPFISGTMISAGHNRPGEEFRIIVTIFDATGRIIRMIKTTLVQEGYQITPVYWDGNNNYGKRPGKGLYPYRVTVTTGNGETATISGRMIIL
jgi:hypothetical protein